MRPAASIPLLLATILGAPADAQCPVAKLEPSKGAGAPITYGMCCAISDQFALVGAPYIPGRVFVYDTSTWQELYTRKSPIKKHTAFRYSVAIDGVLGVVGAPQDDSQGKDAGAVFVYDLQAWCGGGVLHRGRPLRVAAAPPTRRAARRDLELPGVVQGHEPRPDEQLHRRTVHHLLTRAPRSPP